ncbi:MAG: hypothetical protein ACRD17_11320 [Terriglobales bacterium]
MLEVMTAPGPPNKPMGFSTVLEWLEAQRAALDAAIENFRVLANVADSRPGGGGFAIGNAHASIIAPGEIPAGAFHGKSLPDAAVLYLQLVKQKQKASEIAAALLRGGVHTKAKPEKFNNQVFALLDRASKKEGAQLMKMENAYWGLREWLPPSVRNSISAAPPARKSRAAKKRKAHVAPTKGATPTAKELGGSGVTGGAAVGALSPPRPESTEGRILAVVREQPTKEWTAREVAAATDAARIQTVIFLLGKLAHRNMLQKTPNGGYRSML